MHSRGGRGGPSAGVGARWAQRAQGLGLSWKEASHPRTHAWQHPQCPSGPRPHSCPHHGHHRRASSICNKMQIGTRLAEKRREITVNKTSVAMETIKNSLPPAPSAGNAQLSSFTRVIATFWL